MKKEWSGPFFIKLESNLVNSDPGSYILTHEYLRYCNNNIMYTYDSCGVLLSSCHIASGTSTTPDFGACS